MPAARYPKRPRLIASPRHEIDESKYRTIDATLKAARQCAQQVSPLEACLQDEARVLERVYYKGVNQHRSAKFWKRVQEARRLGRRVLEVQFLALLEDLRYSFYVGEGSERNPKILRGVWTQVPDIRSLTFFYERLAGLSELLATAEERLSKAFHALSLMMQTGAFLQTVVVLTAIIARLRAIMEELGSVLRSFLISYETLLQALGHKRVKSQGPEMAKLPALDVQVPRTDQQSLAAEAFGEDLGASVQRKIPPGSAVDSTSSVQPLWKDGNQATPDEEVPPPDSQSMIITTTPTRAREFASRTESSVQTGSCTKEARKVKKKQKRKDSIDEIFGTL